MENSYFLTCLICLEPARDAVESECCHSIYCQECAENIKQATNKACPKCRHNPFKWKESVLARRMIASMPYECLDCKYKATLGDANSHGLTCLGALRKCRVINCTFKGKIDEFFLHLAKEHKTELLSAFVMKRHPIMYSDAMRRCRIGRCTFTSNTEAFFAHIAKDHKRELLIAFDLNAKAPSKPAEENNKSEVNHQPVVNDSLIGEKVNQKGLKAHLGKTGKYYCGGKLGGYCMCCEGHCGPTTGCNCFACMKLDIETRNLPLGYWVNADGAVCTKEESGMLYCGRKMDSTESCGPKNGPQCDACVTLEGQLDGRYAGLNQLS